MKIFAALVLTVLFYMFIQWIIFQFHKYDVIDISSIAQPLPLDEWDGYKQTALMYYGDSNFGSKFDENIYQCEGYTVTFKKQSYMIRKKNNRIYIIISKNKETIFETTLSPAQEIGKFWMDVNAAFDLHRDHFYFLYSNTSKSAQNYVTKTHLLIADLRSKTITFHDTILDDASPFTMAIAYHEPTQSLLIAYQDNTDKKSSDEQLTYAIYDPSKRIFIVQPKSLFPYDTWQKSHPKFLRDTDGILYLLNTSGERWGVLSYAGAPTKGISIINNQGEPSDYFILRESAEMMNTVLRNHILTYSLRLKDEYDDEKIKSIDLEVVKK